MDVVKLRKLAHKSVWDYGKFQGITIRDLMISNRKYIVWAYYNLEKISFIDEILDELASYYKKFKRIDKPGKDPQYYEDNFSFEYAKLTKKELFNLITANRLNGKQSSPALISAYRNAKARYIHANRVDFLSKDSLQAFNQGRAYEEKLIAAKAIKRK